jgi:hypothetical protein
MTNVLEIYNLTIQIGESENVAPSKIVIFHIFLCCSICVLLYASNKVSQNEQIFIYSVSKIKKISNKDKILKKNAKSLRAANTIKTRPKDENPF